MDVDWNPGRQEVEQILRDGQVLTLGINTGAAPHLVPMNYGYRDGALYLHCGLRGSKVELLRRDPQVSFVAVPEHSNIASELACRWTVSYRSVRGRGRATLVEDEAGKIEGYDILMEQHGAEPGQYKPRSIERSYIIRIDITEASAKAYNPGGG